MKVWIIKHKGKTWWGNLVGYTSEVSFSDGTAVYAGKYFFKKKDALRFMKTWEYHEFYEVVSAEVEESKQDNRKSNQTT